jgi:hypothetical protein
MRNLFQKYSGVWQRRANHVLSAMSMGLDTIRHFFDHKAVYKEELWRLEPDDSWPKVILVIPQPFSPSPSFSMRG